MSNTINPNQIRSGAPGQLVGTNSSGQSGEMQIIGAAGITVTVAGNEIIIGLTNTPLSISSFTGYQLVETGYSIVNPAFTATYNGTPISANITNSDGVNSPFTLTSPYLSATITGTFVHTSPATTTFTLHASDGTNNPTQNQTLNWANRIFGGVGASGATPTVTASGTTAVLSTGDVLPSVQLGTESIGEVLGSFNPSGQYVYLLLINPGHTFTDANTGFPFAFNAPASVSFVNVNGATVSMYLYRSTNALTGNFQPKVAT